MLDRAGRDSIRLGNLQICWMSPTSDKNKYVKILIIPLERVEK